MSTCKSQRDHLKAYLAGEITPHDLEALLSHATHCEECRGILELHRELAVTDSVIPLPTDDQFRALRQRVMRETARPDPDGSLAVSSTPTLYGRLAGWWRRSPVLKPAVVGVLLVLAVLGGRWSAERESFQSTDILDELQREAALQTGLDSFWNSPTSYQNVTVRSRPDGALELGFDACRHIETTTSRDSPLAREVLVHAILDRHTLGTRLHALQLVPEMRDDRLRDALVFTLHNDPEPAVRLQALSALKRDPDDARVREALLLTLRDDPSVQLRLTALDALASRGADAQTVRSAIDAVDQLGDEAVVRQATRLMGL